MRLLTRNERGFTLIELLVTVGIASILMATAAVSVNRYLPVYRLREATRDLASTMQQTRYEAIRRSSRCVVAFNVDINGTVFDYAAYVDNGPQNFQYDAGEVVLATQNFTTYGSGISFDLVNVAGEADGVDFEDNSLGFNSRGIAEWNAPPIPPIPPPPPPTNTVYLTNNQDRARGVTANVAGNVRVRSF